jgi:hypothetical protein
VKALAGDFVSATRPAATKKVAILQSNYLPWKGYFDLINDCDLFVFYDDVQFTKNDWRNRNRVKTAAGVRWLTVPVGAEISRRICDVTLPNTAWQTKHYRTLAQAYAKAPHFARYKDFLEDVYLGTEWRTLSELNQYTIRTIARDFLGIRTEFADSSAHASQGSGSERVLALCNTMGATCYVSGPAAKAYLDEAAFHADGVAVEWKDYGGYPEYPQSHPPFEHAVTVLDLLFHAGPDAPDYIWGWRRSKAA